MKINASIFAIIVSAFVMNGCGHVDDDNVDPFPPNDVNKDSTNAHPQETYIINHPVPFSPESAEAKALLGKWKAVKDGLGDLKKQNLFLEFGNDGILSYETHVGFEDHTLVISNYGFKEDWTYNETLGALEGTLLCTLINRDNHEHDSYYCFVTNDLLVLYYGGIQNVPYHISLMDPATYYERIK